MSEPQAEWLVMPGDIICQPYTLACLVTDQTWGFGCDSFEGSNVL